MSLWTSSRCYSATILTTTVGTSIIHMVIDHTGNGPMASPQEHGIHAMLRSNDISEMIPEIYTVERCDFLKPILRSQMIKCFVIQEQKSESRVYSDFV